MASVLLLSLLCLLACRAGHGQAVVAGCDDFSTKSVVVASSQDALQLSQNLTRCPGAEFEVEWQGAVVITEPLGLANGTSLKVTGGGEYSSVVDGNGGVPLFAVNASTLLLEGLALTGGDGDIGGVVAARDGAAVTFTDCDVFGNKAATKGGAIYLEGSTFTAGGVNFTANEASVFGGVIYAKAQSTVTTVDGTANFFQKNEAKYGGVMFLEDESNVIFGNGEASLTNNHADFQGGAIYAENYCVVKTDGTTLLEGNEAGNNGGAVYAINGTMVVATGNTSFVDNISNNYGGAVMVTEDASVRTRGDTEFLGNYAKNDGGAIQAEYTCNVLLAGKTAFIANSAGNLGGAINGYDGVGITTVGASRFAGNSAAHGGAVYADKGATLSLSGALTFQNNTAFGDGGALHITYASMVSITGRPQFLFNAALAGSGGGIYCSSVTEVFFKNAKFVGNDAVWGGGVALFSSGAQGSSSSSSESSTRTSLYDPSDLTPSLSTSTETTFDTPQFSADADGGGGDTPSGSGSGSSSGSGSGSGSGSDSSSGSSSSSSSAEAPVRFKHCSFAENHASEDGGGIYSVAGFDVIRESTFTSNSADSSGGAIVHAGVLEELSDSVFQFNRAGNEGPAILSLGLLKSMTGATFRGNSFFCEPGKFSAAKSSEEDTCRFERVCARCASDCDSDLEEGASVADSGLIPSCEQVPEGTITRKRGGTLNTLELQPGFYRSSAQSTDVRECFHEDACRGGDTLGSYCAPGYGGPYCAVCMEGYAPGYSHTCKSCMGGSKRRAVGIMSVIFGLVVLATGLIIARLVSVVQIEQPVPTPGKAQAPWRQKVTMWQGRARKAFPLTAVKIVVVVWQIVTQYSDVAGVQYPGAYNDFLAVIDLVNLDLGFILSFACVYDTNFYDRLLLATLGPFVVFTLLGCTYMVARHRNRRSREAIATVKRRHLSVALFVMFVVYATVSYTVFETFVCDTMDDGNSYLRADYSVTCSTPLHTGYKVYAALMVMVYPVGFPCVFGWWLFKYRNELTEEDRQANPEIRPLADLWEPYKRDKYYYEVVECFRRIALTGFAVFIYPDSSAQIAIVLLLAAMFMVVSEILSPFARPVEMWLYRAGHYVVFASMYLALLLRVDVSSERDQSQDVFSGVVVIAHAVMLIVVVSQGLLIFVGWGDLVEAPEAFAVIDRRSTPDRTRQYAMEREAAGCGRAPWGGKFGSSMPSPVGNGYGDAHACADEKEGSACVGEKGQRWGALQAPSAKPKNTFFKKRAGSLPIRPYEKDIRHSRDGSRGSSVSCGSDMIPAVGTNGPWKIAVEPWAAARQADARAAAARAEEEEEKGKERAAAAAAAAAAGKPSEVHEAPSGGANPAAKARSLSPKRWFSGAPGLGYPSADTVVDSSPTELTAADALDTTRVGHSAPSPAPEEVESECFAAAMAALAPTTSNVEKIRQFPGLKRSAVNISNNSSFMTNGSTPATTTFRDRFFGSPGAAANTTATSDDGNPPAPLARAPRFGGDKLESPLEESPWEKGEETPTARGRETHRVNGGGGGEPRSSSMPSTSPIAAAAEGAKTWVSTPTATSAVPYGLFASPAASDARDGARGPAASRGSSRTPSRGQRADRRTTMDSPSGARDNALDPTSRGSSRTPARVHRAERRATTDPPLARRGLMSFPRGNQTERRATMGSPSRRREVMSLPRSRHTERRSTTGGSPSRRREVASVSRGREANRRASANSPSRRREGRSVPRVPSGLIAHNSPATVRKSRSTQKRVWKPSARSHSTGDDPLARVRAHGVSTPGKRGVQAGSWRDAGLFSSSAGNNKVVVISTRAKTPVMTSKSRAESAGPIGAWQGAGLFASSAGNKVVVTSSRAKAPAMTAKRRAESAGPMGGRSGRWLIKPHDHDEVFDDDPRERSLAVVERKVKIPTSRSGDAMRGNRVNENSRSSLLARAASTEDGRHASHGPSSPDRRRASLGASGRGRTGAGAGAAGAGVKRRGFPST